MNLRKPFCDSERARRGEADHIYIYIAGFGQDENLGQIRIYHLLNSEKPRNSYFVLKIL
jgi:hypothetical protein